jgi:hypothetical protein
MKQSAILHFSIPVDSSFSLLCDGLFYQRWERWDKIVATSFYRYLVSRKGKTIHAFPTLFIESASRFYDDRMGGSSLFAACANANANAHRDKNRHTVSKFYAQS